MGSVCPHCGEPMTPDTPATVRDELAYAQAEMLTMEERTREQFPERPQVSAQVALAGEHLRDAWALIGTGAPVGARLYAVGEPEGGSVDPRPTASCNLTSRERDALRERVRMLEQGRPREPEPPPSSGES